MNSHNYDVSPIAAFNDNYIWLITRPDSNQCVVVDPGDANVVIAQLATRQLELAAVLVTHHHQDHIGGIAQLRSHAALNKQPFTVYGPKIEAQSVTDIALEQGDIAYIEALGLTLKVLDLPGHTLGHIAFYDQDSLFCGDTLFAGGCGRLFEGSPQQMAQSLQKLAELPGATKVYCAHEYTLSNLDFAQAVEPTNETISARIAYCQQQRLLKQPTVPSTIEQERATNPFLRTKEATVIASIVIRSSTKPIPNSVETFAQLRQWKDNF
ncbi:MAG: hydroxyacylglutathione hydrolase [Gammaproteobacteria bacterium]|nr:hydroxyacylglutathione hydrolase [Gammaproteobacteria bacterium]